MKNLVFSALVIITCIAFVKREAADTTLFKNATLIDGNGGSPVTNIDILIKGDKITDIGKNLDPSGSKIIDLQGKFIMPTLSSTHSHIGLLKGTATKAENYTRENILNQLTRYGTYGVTNILIMGSDRPMLFEGGLRDSSVAGLLPGARLYSAGYGFGVPGAAPPATLGFDILFRPASAAQVAAEMDSLAVLHPTVVKLWLDDFAGNFTKMAPEIYRTIISEAHKHGLRVAAHVYYLSDAKLLIAAGVDIIAHSIRDKDVDTELLQEMKKKKVVYVPTLSLDEFAYIYARKPEWIADPFFKASLEPGVYEMITSQKYQDDIKSDPGFARNAAAFETALRNLKKIFDAGIFVSLGTDSGATPIRAQGFSEHLELELLVQAGLTPLQAITIGTKNPCIVLEKSAGSGTIEKGKTADFIILDRNPVDDIKNTHTITAVYKSGKQISRGILRYFGDAKQ